MNTFLKMGHRSIADLWLRALIVLSVVVIGLFSYMWLRLPSAGLAATYYPNPDWRGAPMFTHLEKEISLAAFDRLVAEGRLPAQQSSIAWNGWIHIAQAGEYCFYTASDDGSSIMLDQQLVLDNGGFHDKRTQSRKLWLTEGKHRITISYFNGTGDAALKVWWQDLTNRETPLPATALFTQPPATAHAVFARYGVAFAMLYGLAWGLLLWVSYELLTRRLLVNRVCERTFWTLRWFLTIAGLVVIIVANYWWRHTVEDADHYITGRYFKNFYDVKISQMLDAYYTHPRLWWKLLLPLPGFDVWRPTSSIVNDIAQTFLPHPAISWYLFQALLILVAFMTSWGVFHSRMFSYTLSICLGFGTQLIVTYCWSICAGQLLLFSYFLGLLFFSYKVIQSDTRQLLWKFLFTVSLLCTALAYEGWLDFVVFAFLAFVYLAVIFTRLKQKQKFRRLLFLFGMINGCVILYISVYLRFHYGDTHFSTGTEGDMVFNYPSVIIAVEDMISKYLTLFYVALTNFMPPFLLTSNSLVLYGPQKLIDWQYGYYPPNVDLIPMQHIFLWRYYAGGAFAVFAYFLVKAIRKSLKAFSPDYIAVSLFMLMVAVTSPAKCLIKARGMASVPLYSTWVLFSVLGMAFLISWVTMLVRRKKSRGLSTGIIVLIWSMIFLSALIGPAYVNVMSEIVHVQELCSHKFPVPLEKLFPR